MKLSLDNPPQVRDVLVHNGATITDVCQSPLSFWANGINWYPCQYIGLEVTRPAKKVTGELIGELVSGESFFNVDGIGFALCLQQLLNEGNRLVVIKLEDGNE